MTHNEYIEARLRHLEEQNLAAHDRTRHLERQMRVCIGFIFVLMPLAAFGITIATTMTSIT